MYELITYFHEFCNYDFFRKNVIERNANVVNALVTKPMLKRRPNRTELRLMDSYIQVLCRLQKCKRKVPPLLLLSNEKSPFTPQRIKKGDFSLLKYKNFFNFYINLDIAIILIFVSSKFSKI
jgi:hypothetical protein